MAGVLERYLARRYLACALLVAAVAATLLAGLALMLPALAPDSPWALAAPCLVAAAWLARRRTVQLGEDEAIARAGWAPLGAWRLAIFSALLMQALACLFGAGRSPAPHPFLQPDRVYASLEGDLLLRRPDGLVVLDRRGDLHLRPPSAQWPEGVTPAPPHPGRSRRRAFFAFSPWRPGLSPDDPVWARWVWVLAGLAGVAAVLSGRPKEGVCGAVAAGAAVLFCL